MQILFIISILCFLVLVWAGIAIARHIRLSHRAAPAASQRSFADYLFTAKVEQGRSSTRPIPQQTVRDIAANKSWNKPSASVQIPPANDENPVDLVQGKRKGPQAAHHGTSERLDWEYFNKDAGDLTDPYPSRNIRANSRPRATSAKRF